MGNWPDLRDKKKISYMCSWCHGAAGMGMSRICSLSFLDEPELRSEIAAALETTQKTFDFDGSVDHLCCGHFGRIEFLRMAAKEFGDPTLLSFARRQASIRKSIDFEYHFAPDNVSKIGIWATQKLPRLNDRKRAHIVNMGTFTIVQPRGFGAAEIPIFETFSV